MADKHHLFAVTYWLLNAATLLMFLLMGVMVLGVIALGVAGLVGVDIDLPADLGMSMAQLLRVGIFGLLAALVCLSLLLVAIMLTTRIVESAMAGNPFVPENATRLSQVGWLLLAIEVAGFFIALMVEYLVPEKFAGDVNFDMSPVGLVGILLIFVLAQIFRHGSEMRAELESTV